MQVILEHTTTKFKRYYPEIEVKTENVLHFTIELNVEDLEDGEYIMTIYKDNNEVITKDLVRIGDYKIMEYKVEKKFTQYVRK